MKLLVVLEEEERQMMLLALAIISLQRPGVNFLCSEIAVKLRGLEMFESFKEMNRDATRTINYLSEVPEGARESYNRQLANDHRRVSGDNRPSTSEAVSSEGLSSGSESESKDQRGENTTDHQRRDVGKEPSDYPDMND